MGNVNTYISSIALDLTYNCNFRCRHCYNSSGEHHMIAKEMPNEKYLEIAKEIAELGPSQVCLCGGETLLKKDLLCQIIRTIKEVNPKVLVNTVSNGYLMTPEIAKELKDAGIYSVQISLDGATKEVHEWLRGHEGAFEHATNALRYLTEAGINPGVACCPTKKNFEQIPEIAKLAFELGSNIFRIQPIMIIGRAKEISEFALSELEYTKLARTVKKLNKEYQASGKMIEWGDPVSHVYSMRNKRYFETLIINAYGEILISPYIPISFGNVNKHPLKEYIESDISRVLDLKLMQEIFGSIDSPENMDLHSTYKKFPALYESEFLHIDLIDDDIEEKSNSLMYTLSK
jgi:MoaA/NifB/PqqE/SkfB family radical SAM enzyme